MFLPYFGKRARRRWTTSFTTPSPEDFFSISNVHLPVESRLNLMRVWRASRAAVVKAMACGSIVGSG